MVQTSVNRKIITATPFGPLVTIWRRGESGAPKVARIFISGPDESAIEKASKIFPDIRTGSCVSMDRFISLIVKSLSGKAVRFSLDIIDLSLCRRFQESVLRAEHSIPRGKVSTYGIIASHLGKTGGARAVGNSLAENPFPIVVPCHRAIRSDGSLGGYQGGTGMKRALLDLEGIRFDDKGRVDSEFFRFR